MKPNSPGKQWTTEIHAVDPTDDHFKKFSGPHVPGDTKELAEKYCRENNLPYCKVVAEWEEDIEVSGEEFENINAD